MLRGCFFFILLFSGAIWAQESCYQKLNGLQKSFNHQQVYQNDLLKVEKILPGKHGGKLLVIRRWDSSEPWKIPLDESFKNAPPGDPTKFVKAMPRRISNFFNYKLLDSNFEVITPKSGIPATYVVIPDVYEINGALKALDKKLKKSGYAGIPFRFYLDEEVSSNETFLRNFVVEKGFPYSTDRVISYHDLNYHFMPMFVFNEAVMQRAFMGAEIFLKFGAWLKSHYPHAASESALSTIYGIRATNLDMSGNISLYLADTEKPENKLKAVRAFKSFAGWGYAPSHYLREVMNVKLKDGTDLSLSKISMEMVDQFLKTLGPEDMKEDSVMRELFKDEKQILAMIERRIFEIEMALVKAQASVNTGESAP